ncbi:hypothetical protein [Streptomyces lydicus]|uniref:hypothetical protein n=1 Tax=Streptomyces lydicus TaxID=47763 RepID=UPI0037948D99
MGEVFGPAGGERDEGGMDASGAGTEELGERNEFVEVDRRVRQAGTAAGVVGGLGPDQGIV